MHKMILLLPVLAALGAAGAQAANTPSRLERRILFVGGPTTARWEKIAPQLFDLPQMRVEIAADGKSSTMLAEARHALAKSHFNAVHVLPESGLSGESPAATEADIAALGGLAEHQGARFVVAAPLYFGTGAAPSSDAVLDGWAQAEATKHGWYFGDYHSTPMGALLPLSDPNSLVARTVLIRGALDASFRTVPRVSAAEAMKRMILAREMAPDTLGTGPYPAVREIDPALPSHTFFRPANLAPFVHNKMPVLIFGNGGCSNDSGDARLFLEEIASHGYLVIAPGYFKTGIGAYPTPAKPGLVPPGSRLGTNTKDLLAALDWITHPSSANAGWLQFMDPSKIAVAGWSCGGLEATETAFDPRISTAIILSSGIFTAGNFGIPGVNLTKNDLKRIHTPMLYILGGATDVAFENGSDDFNRITTAPEILISREDGHMGTFLQPNGGVYAQAATAWLDWHLKNNPQGRADFMGNPCGLCADPNWTIERKGY